MGLPGRKSAFEEKQIAQRYADLTPQAFEFLSECLNGQDKVDKKWAIEQLQKGWVKMIPQVTKIGGDEDNQTPIPITLLQGVTQDVPGDYRPSQSPGA